VMFAGQDLLSCTAKQLRELRGGQIAHVFQDPLSTLHPLFSVGEQIIESIRAHQHCSYRDARQCAIDLLDAVRIPNASQRVDAYPHQLSGGMRQRVGIAMALANDAEVLVADEPTTALDVTVQAQVLQLLDDLRKRRRVAVLFITHDFGVVAAICDRVAVMYAGQIVEIGPAQELLSRPAHPYTHMLIDCVPVLGEPERGVDAIEGLPPAVNRLPVGCSFAERCPRADGDCQRAKPPLSPWGANRAVRCIHPIESDR